MEKSINLIVELEENDLRVDVLINKREQLISRTRIKNLILKEKLKINKLKNKKNKGIPRFKIEIPNSGLVMRIAGTLSLIHI